MSILVLQESLSGSIGVHARSIPTKKPFLTRIDVTSSALADLVVSQESKTLIEVVSFTDLTREVGQCTNGLLPARNQAARLNSWNSISMRHTT